MNSMPCIAKITSYISLSSYVETYVPVLNEAKGMHALKITASGVLFIRWHFLIERNRMTLHI